MRWRSHVVDCTLRAIRALPEPAAWWLGGMLGHWYAHWVGRDVGRCRRHLTLAFPERDRAWVRDCARRCFAHFGRMGLWTVATLHRPSLQQSHRVPLEGGKNFLATAAELRRGSGVLVVSGHLGNWELLARCTGAVVPITVLGRRLRYPELDRLIIAARSDGGRNRVIFQDQGMAACLRELRQGRIMATLPDQDVGRLAGCFVPFFGRPAYTPLGPALMAVMTRRPVQPVYCLLRNGRWVFHWGPQLWPDLRLDRQAAAVALTARFTAYQERIIRQLPWQWVWWHKRWRHAPADKPDAPVVQGPTDPQP